MVLPLGESGSGGFSEVFEKMGEKKDDKRISGN